MTPDIPTLNRLLAEHAESQPDQPFIHHSGGTYSYLDVWKLSERFAGYLMEIGVGKGDCVCIALPRRPEYLIAFLGATRIGALPVAVNFFLPLADIIAFVRSLRAPVILARETLLDDLVTGLASAGSPAKLIDVESRHPGCVSWDEIRSRAVTTMTDSVRPGDVAYLNYTTGTSGQPKGALATHENIYWNTRSAIDCLGLTGHDVHLCMFSSFAHPHELFCRALTTGASLVLLEEINPKTIAQAISTYSVTCMMGLAPMYEMMASYCDSSSFSSLRLAESGGMYTSPATNRKFLDKAGVPIMSVWGSTETTGIALANNADECRLDGSMGKVCPHYEVRLVDELGNDVAADQVGELLFRGKAIVAGYNQGRVLDCHDGWYHSGDLARRDKDGFFYYVDRISGMIKVAGLKVYPLQIEILLQQLDGVAEVAVIGVWNKRKGAVPIAVIVPEEGARLTVSKVVAFCRGRLPNYMIPKQIIFVEQLPKIGSGKIDKRTLTDRYASSMKAPGMTIGE